MGSPAIAVIGGGVSGLCCVSRLLELREKTRKDFEVFLFEKGNRLGGTIETLERDGFTLEAGPDAFLSEKPWGVELCEKLGISSQLIGTKDENRKSFVVRRGRLLPLPEGFYLIAPTEIRAFLKSRLFSLPGKLRILMEPLLPRRASASDESVASFLRRRFGAEALERVGQPMLAGIHTGNAEMLSLAATMPRFGELERRYGSVIRGLWAVRHDARGGVREASGPRYSLFLSFREGMETLTRALAARVPRGVARLGTGVQKISRDGTSGPWRLLLSTGEMRTADAVCFAASAKTAALSLKETAPALSEKLASVAYESVATINFACRREDISHPLDGFGFVVPQTEKSVLVACSFASQKFSSRAPEGCVLLRAFVGGAFGRDYFRREDQDLTVLAERELGALLGIRGKPLFTFLRRTPDSMVQYRVGHLELVKEIENETATHAGLFLTGSSYRGVGIPDCIHDAERTAERIVEYLIT